MHAPSLAARPVPSYIAAGPASQSPYCLLILTGNPMRLASAVSAWASLASLLASASAASASPAASRVPSAPQRLQQAPRPVLAASHNPDNPEGERERRDLGRGPRVPARGSFSSVEVRATTYDGLLTIFRTRINRRYPLVSLFRSMRQVCWSLLEFFGTRGGAGEGGATRGDRLI